MWVFLSGEERLCFAGDIDIDPSSDVLCARALFFESLSRSKPPFLDTLQVRLLALCWKMGAAKPSEIAKTEWEAGCEANGIDSLEKLKAFTHALDPHSLDHR